MKHLLAWLGLVALALSTNPKTEMFNRAALVGVGCTLWIISAIYDASDRHK